MYSYKLNNSYTIYVNYTYLNECIKASRGYNSNSNEKSKTASPIYTMPVGIKNVAKVGSQVSVLNLDTQKRDIFKITFSENVNISKGFISDISPIGRSLLGHGIGDTIMVKAPIGTVRYKIVDLRN